MIRQLISSGHAVDLVLAVMAAEFAFLYWRRAAVSDLVALAVDLFCALAPGACLLLALRAALTGADWGWIAVFLALSFPIHLTDLARRRLFSASRGATTLRS